MKKFIAVASALCTAFCCFSGCSDKSSKETAEESSLIEVMIPLEMPDINISVPESYEKTSTDSNDTVYIKNDASVIVNSDKFTDAYKNVDEYADYALETYKTYSDNVEVLAFEDMTVADTEGKLMECIYSLNEENGVFSKYCMAAFFSDGEQMYLVTCKADPDRYKEYRDEFIDIVESVSFKK